MPFELLRALVVSLLEPDEGVDTELDTELDIEPMTDGSGQPTEPRASTLDELIATLV